MYHQICLWLTVPVYYWRDKIKLNNIKVKSCRKMSPVSDNAIQGRHTVSWEVS